MKYNDGYNKSINSDLYKNVTKLKNPKSIEDVPLKIIDPGFNLNDLLLLLFVIFVMTFNIFYLSIIG